MATFPVTRASRFTLRESVADSLRTGIADGSLAAGTHLAEVELSDSFGVSRATLREALRHLQQEGLLEQDSRGRVSVRSLAVDEVRDIFEVRLALEGVALERLCAVADRAPVVAELRGKLNRLKVEVSLSEDLDADLEFHATMCRLAGNPTLYRTWQSLSGLIRITMVAAGPQSARENLAFDRHAPIVDLIETGDASAALGFLAQHMASAADALIGRMAASAS